ncbi:MAG: hypothetical protein A2603_09305 [Bdellovibrionales bacterium RIFOXYD1_FULL_55_31]|nr:MAG: hypothetical protein A2603_09305 [Bdellovibrionales bacterium RIFOXYD1_FULL_55_31]
MSSGLYLPKRFFSKLRRLGGVVARLVFGIESKPSSGGHFAAQLCHELSNPLSVITAKSSQIQNWAETKQIDPEKLAKAALEMQKMAKRISAILNGLKEIESGTETLSFHSVPLKSVIDETLELCSARFRLAGIQVHVEYPPPGVILECRATQISEVLFNLLNNAFDALADSGSGFAAEGKWVQLSSRVLGGTIELSVTDSGSGIPEKFRERVLEPFFTTKPPGKGLGLGLSISKQLVEAHRGELLLDPSHPNTRFLVRLPLRQVRAHAA